MNLSGNKLVLLIAGLGACWVAWSYASTGKIPVIGQSSPQPWGNRNHTGFAPMWDPLGLMPGQGQQQAGRRMRMPGGYGNAGQGDREERFSGPRPPLPDLGVARRERGERRGGGRWRDCRADRSGCGEWHDGSPPGREGRGRW